MANISEIARAAGVSTTTVSRVLNGKPDVKPKTREKILELVRKYDFYPNASARAISSTKKINVIGLIIPYDANYIFSNPFNVEVMRGVSMETNAAGYHLMLCHYQSDEYISVYKQKWVAGFILVSPGKDQRNMVTRLQEIGAPFVSTSKIPNLPDVPVIEVDNFHGASLAIEHLIALGHRRIGAIKGINLLASSVDRFAGYCAVLQKHGIEVDGRLVVEGRTSIESGHTAMQELMKNTDMTAVFAASDLMAIGAIGAAVEAGKNVPRDISVVGYDNIPLAGLLSPSLTTIDQHASIKGGYTAKMLIDILEGRDVTIKPEIQVDLVVRGSSGECTL